MTASDSSELIFHRRHLPPDNFNQQPQLIRAVSERRLFTSEKRGQTDWRLHEEIDLTFIQLAKEWSYFIGDVEMTPEVYEAGKQAVKMVVEPSLLNGDNSLVERAVNSEKGLEAWRTANAIDCALTLCRGTAEGAWWFRPNRPNRRVQKGDLTDEQYAKFSLDTREAIGDSETLTAFLVALLEHDMGKSEKFKNKARKAGTDTRDKDHDMILRDVVASPKKRDMLLPTLAQLKQSSPEGYELATKLLLIKANYAQLLLGEAPAIVMKEILGLEPRLRKLFFLKHRLDIGGAMGHRQHAGSLTLDSETFQDMEDLEWAMTTDELEFSDKLDEVIVRNNAYLRRRGIRMGVDVEELPPSERAKMYACIRLTIQPRNHDRSDLEKVVRDFETEPEVIRSILTELLNRNGATDKAILPGYGPAVLMALSKDPQFANNYLTIYAMLLHEAEMFRQDRGVNDTGITATELNELAKEINLKSVDLGSGIRFTAEKSGDDVVLKPRLLKPTIETLAMLPNFDGEILRGKRVLAIGMAGGADNLHAGAAGSTLIEKYGAELAGIMTIRKPDNILRGTEKFGASATHVTAESIPHGAWSRGGDIDKVLLNLLQTPKPPRISISNATSVGDIGTDIKEFQQLVDADIILAFDPGCDSLTYVGQYKEDAKHLATRQDHTVIQAIDTITKNTDIHALYVGVVPDLYTNENSLPIMIAGGASVVPLTFADKEQLIATYQRLGMLSGKDARYSTTAMAFEKSAHKQLGLQSFDLPTAVSKINPWRIFYEVTDVMDNIIIMTVGNHRRATRGAV